MLLYREIYLIERIILYYIKMIKLIKRMTFRKWKNLGQNIELLINIELFL